MKKKRGAFPAGKVATGEAEELRRQAEQLRSTIHRIEDTSRKLHEEIGATHGGAHLAHIQSGKGLIKDGDGKASFPIVGIGASAGGLEALTLLLNHLPADTGMAFVVVQHLDPTHESALTSLLGRATEMEVTEARNNMTLLPNWIYVIPPNKKMGILGHRLKLSPRSDSGADDHMPIDRFFQSLASEHGENAVGVILSGNGTDGTQGLLAIKASGGITFAQDKRSAKYPGMPGNAIASGCVDFVLAPDTMVRELKRFSSRPSLLPVEEKLAADLVMDEKAFEEILTLLRQRTGVDFTFYKHATLRRRMHRRMVLHKFETLRAYGQFLRSHGAEVKELFNDILIHVTGFFRDTAVFQTLRKRVFPRLLKGKRPQEPLRIWIPGCSTGEEVYSVAISLVELMNEKKSRHPTQIFATDVNDSSLEKARSGIYPESIQSEVSADRLRRFFVKVDGGYRVNKTLREMCIFARQNLVHDPPFSNLDLISCRNVLIYLGPTLQRKVMPVFHYALRSAGLLMLGASETIGAFPELFSLLDKKAKIYAKKSLHQRPSITFGHRLPEVAASVPADGTPQQGPPSIADVQKQADRIVLTSYSLPGVVINQSLEVLQFRGRTGIFLEHSHGEATLNLLKMAREGLMSDLRSVIAKAINQNIRVRQEGLRVRQNGHFQECNVEVVPFALPPGHERFYLVLFETAAPAPAETKRRSTKQTATFAASDSRELAHLREELGATRESLQAIIEEQEATNEELRSANEEIMSSNEELQSTNEELETAKEELQSTNEELTTLNDELESRNTELEQVNNDLYNLLASVNIPVVILSADLRIRRFTAMAEKLLKLIPGDIGRPITDIAMPLEIPALGRQVLDVFESLTPKDIETQDKEGHWWSVRIRPYKTTDHKIDGAVIAFLDINLLKSSLRVRGEDDFAEAMLSTAHEPFLLLDEDLTVRAANGEFYRTFQFNPEEILARSIYDLAGWNISRLRVCLETLKRNPSFTECDLGQDLPRAGKKKFRLNGRRLISEGGAEAMILLAFGEVTG